MNPVRAPSEATRRDTRRWRAELDSPTAATSTRPPVAWPCRWRTAGKVLDGGPIEDP